MKTVSITEQFCSLTQRVKTDVTLNELDKAQFREADVQRVSKALILFMDQESLCQIQQNDETRSSVGPNGHCGDTNVRLVVRNYSCWMGAYPGGLVFYLMFSNLFSDWLCNFKL